MIWVLPILSFSFISTSNGFQERAVKNPSASIYWPHGKIPYVINEKAKPYESTIKSAISEWQSGTCLKFEQKPNANAVQNKNALIFDFGQHPLKKYLTKDCVSPWHQDMSANVNRAIHLQTNCTDKTRIMREIGLQLGLFYEHQRPDRNDYVSVLKDSVFYNIKQEADNMGIPYDFSSVMHVPSWDQEWNGNVVIPKNKFRSHGAETKPSLLDKKAINKMYKCHDKCSNPIKCDHHGTVKHPQCDKCDCPLGYSGNHCEEYVGGKYAVGKIKTAYHGMIDGAVASHVAEKYIPKVGQVYGNTIGAMAGKTVVDVLSGNIQTAPYSAVAGGVGTFFVERLAERFEKKWGVNTASMLGGALESSVADLLKGDLDGAIKNAASNGAGALVGQVIGEAIGAEFGGPAGAMIGAAAGNVVAELTGELVDKFEDEIHTIWKKVKGYYAPMAQPSFWYTVGMP